MTLTEKKALNILQFLHKTLRKDPAKIYLFWD